MKNNWNEKNLPEGFKGLFEQVEERMSKLKDRTREIIWVLDTERKTVKEKWTAPKGLEGNSQAQQYIVGVQEEWGGQRVFEVIWPKTSQTWWKTNVNIEEAQWTPSNMDSKRLTLRPIIINFWKTKRESWSSKREVTHYIQRILYKTFSRLVSRDFHDQKATGQYKPRSKIK